MSLKEYSIDKEIPVPRYSPYVKTSRFPFNKMEVGDSFVMPYSERKRFTAATSNRRKKGDKRAFSYRRISENKVRVWRVR